MYTATQSCSKNVHLVGNTCVLSVYLLGLVLEYLYICENRVYIPKGHFYQSTQIYTRKILHGIHIFETLSDLLFLET